MAKRDLVFTLGDRKNDYYKEHEIGVYLRNIVGFKKYATDTYNSSIINIKVNPDGDNEHRIDFILGDKSKHNITNDFLKVKTILDKSSKAYITATKQTSTGNNTVLFDTGVYLDTTEGSLVVEKKFNVGTSSNKIFSADNDAVTAYKKFIANTDVEIKGNTTIQKSLTVNENMAIKGTTKLTGKVTIEGELITSPTNPNDSTFNNNVFIGKNLTVTGTTTSTGKITGKGGMEITGNTVLNNNLTVKGTTNLQGVTTLDNNLVFSQLGNSGTRGISGSIASNDNWFIRGGASGSDVGYLELGTGDNGSEPIYVRQINSAGGETNFTRTLTLLDASGNTSIPGSTTFGGSLTVNGSGTNTFNGPINAKSTLTVAGTANLNGSAFVNGNIRVAGQSFTLSAGLCPQVTEANTMRLFRNGLVISNPGIRNDQGWIRMTGSSESDSVLEIAVGDDGPDSTIGEQIVVRKYNTSNNITNQIILFDKVGNTSFPGTTTIGGNLTVNGGTTTVRDINVRNKIYVQNGSTRYGMMWSESDYVSHNVTTHPGLIIGDLQNTNGLYTIVNNDMYAMYFLKVYGSLYVNELASYRDQLLTVDGSGRIVPTGKTLSTIGGGFKAQGSAPGTQFLWVDTAHGNIIKFYNGSSWVTCSAAWS